MAAGLSKQALGSVIYRRLKKAERELKGKGVQCNYRDREVRGKNFVVFFAISRASNGECAGWQVLRFNPKRQPSAARKGEGDVDYTDFHTRDIPEHSLGGWDAGVARVQAWGETQ